MVRVNEEGDQCSVLDVNVCDKEKIVVVVVQRARGERPLSVAQFSDSGPAGPQVEKSKDKGHRGPIS